MDKSISIITVNYNNIIGLQRTYNSLLELNFYFEWIVIDGFSKDGSIDFIKSISPRFNFKYVIEKDAGIYDAMNKGISMAKYDLMIFLNSGDYFNFKTISIPIERGSIFLIPYKTKNIFGKTIWNRVASSYYSLPVPHQAIIFNNPLRLTYNLKYKLAADYDFYLRIAQTAKNLENFILCDGYVHYERGGTSDKRFIEGYLERWSIIYHNLGIKYFLWAFIKDTLKIPIKFIYIRLV